MVSNPADKRPNTHDGSHARPSRSVTAGASQGVHSHFPLQEGGPLSPSGKGAAQRRGRQRQWVRPAGGGPTP